MFNFFCDCYIFIQNTLRVPNSPIFGRLSFTLVIILLPQRKLILISETLFFSTLIYLVLKHNLSNTGYSWASQPSRLDALLTCCISSTNTMVCCVFATSLLYLWDISNSPEIYTHVLFCFTSVIFEMQPPKILLSPSLVPFLVPRFLSLVPWNSSLVPA